MPLETAELDQALSLDWEKDPDFPEVPSHLLASSKWHHVLADEWKYEDIIVRLEARSITKAVERIANSKPMSGCHFLNSRRQSGCSSSFFKTKSA